MANRVAARARAANFHGIEVVGELVWRGWEPGKEYTKHIVLKNVQLEPKKLRYSVPHTQCFITLFPSPLILSPGTLVKLPVTFKPTERVQYDDLITFTTHDGHKFEIIMRALLPRPELTFTGVTHSVPSEEQSARFADPLDEDFLGVPFCAVNDTISVEITLENTGQLHTRFEWRCDPPFRIEPPQGAIEPSKSLNCTVYFNPPEAQVYTIGAELSFDDIASPDTKFSKRLIIEGIGKYSQLLVRVPDSEVSSSNEDRASDQVPFGPSQDQVIAFGEIPIGTKLVKHISLHNPLPIRVPFKIQRILERVATTADTVFQCLMESGIVPPSSDLLIPVQN